MDSSSACSKVVVGAELVSILTKEENSFVFRLLQDNIQFYNAWIGLTNEDIVRGMLLCIFLQEELHTIHT